MSSDSEKHHLQGKEKEFFTPRALLPFWDCQWLGNCVALIQRLSLTQAMEKKNPLTSRTNQAVALLQESIKHRDLWSQGEWLAAAAQTHTEMIDMRGLIRTRGDLYKKTVNVACPRVLGSAELEWCSQNGNSKKSFSLVLSQASPSSDKCRVENISVRGHPAVPPAHLSVSSSKGRRWM